MILKNECINYLKDVNFSNGAMLKFSGQKQRWSRIEFMKELLKYNYRGGGKIQKRKYNVIHLGCCDHIGLIDNKIKNGTYLHKIITDSSNKVLGIDINSEAISYLKDTLNYNNVICADMIVDNKEVKTKMKEVLGNKKWDYLIVGEILEHVDNPVEFLKKINDEYKNYIKKIVISVPNALRINNFKFALREFECINTDHKYWFTPYTLAKVMYRANMEVQDLYFADFISKKRKRLLKFLDKPIFGETIISIGVLK